MSLQAIEGQKVQSADKNAHQRKIDVASEGMIFDTLQKTQYTKPIDSTVRELATNAVDSIKERDIAREILSEEAKVEDYYLEREGDKYKHSKFDKSYYDLSRFSNEPNVKLIYRSCRNGTGYVDQFVIEDEGVGIGMPRLEGYFDLGFSSKRNTKALLGAFGLGNKVALSTGVDYYIMESRHNGIYHAFKCFSRHIDSLVPRFNDVGMNPVTEFSSGAKAHHELQDGNNFTRITVPTKRFNKDKFIHAVKSQLLYFPNIDFVVEHYETAEDIIAGNCLYTEDITFKALVEHSSTNIVISNNRIYNKPHVIIVRDTNDTQTTGVCYGQHGRSIK